MTTIICEISTNHGGDVDLAIDMVKAAADAGADYAKLQSYSLERLNPTDPQRDWLTQAHLDEAAHERIFQACRDAGVKPLSTPFDSDSLAMLRRLGLREFKIASSESGNPWWCGTLAHEKWFVSWPWGAKPKRFPHFTMLNVETDMLALTHLTAIPLYPTPLEAVGRAPLLDGYSCHAIGNAACLWAIANGAKVIEAHLRLEGRGRQCAWDRTPAQFRELRDFADACETMRSGVSTQFRRRWTA
jgi:N,N'-diacetyllegionaminate synthase